MKDYQIIELMMQQNLCLDLEYNVDDLEFIGLEKYLNYVSQPPPPPQKKKEETTITPEEIAQLLANWENMLDNRNMDEWHVLEDEDFFNFDSKCKHEWVKVQLLNETVFDCKICGAQKEKVDSKKK